MTTENWITIATAILGSGAVATIIQVIAGRFRVDRRADLIRSWKEESDIADDLYYEAIHGRASSNESPTAPLDAANNDSKEPVSKLGDQGEPQSEKAESKSPGIISQASRIAFSRAVRTDLNKRLSFELAPSNSGGILFGYCVSAVLLLGGLILAITGIFFMASAGKDSNPPVPAGALVSVYGALFLALGILLFLYLDTAEKARVRARRIILDVLNVDAPSDKHKITIKNDDLVFIEDKPMLFMKNFPDQAKSNTPTKDLKPNRFRNVLGEDLAFNLDSFLSQTVTVDNFEDVKNINPGQHERNSSN